MVDVYGNLNLKQNQSEFMVLHKGTAFPGSPTPVEGQLFYRSDEEKIYFYNGTAWTEVGTGGGGSGGGLGRYIEVFTSQTSFTVTHDLGDVNPVVQVYDSNAEQITADKIDATGGNTVLVEFNTAQSGFVVVHGGQGIDLGTTAFYDQAFTSLTAVAVGHGLGQKFVHVSVYDATDNLIEPQDVVLVDDNNLCVCFGSAETGCIVVSGGTTDVNTYGVKRYSVTCSGADNYLIAHNLNTETPSVTVYDDATKEIIVPDVTVVNSDCVCVELGATTTICLEAQGGWQSTTPGAGSGDFLPDTNNAYDLGSGSFMWKNGYFAGKLTVCGGIDPEYIQLTPQVGSAGIPNNSMFIDSSNGLAKMKTCSGTVVDLAQGGGGATGTDLISVRQTAYENAMGVTTLSYENAVADVPHDYLIDDLFVCSIGYNETICISPRTDYTLTDTLIPLMLQSCTIMCPQYGYACGFWCCNCVATCSYNNSNPLHSRACMSVLSDGYPSATCCINPNAYCMTVICVESYTMGCGISCCYAQNDQCAYTGIYGYYGGAGSMTTMQTLNYLTCDQYPDDGLGNFCLEQCCQAKFTFVKIAENTFDYYLDDVCQCRVQVDCLWLQTAVRSCSQFCYGTWKCGCAWACWTCMGYYNSDVFGDFTSSDYDGNFCRYSNDFRGTDTSEQSCCNIVCTCSTNCGVNTVQILTDYSNCAYAFAQHLGGAPRSSQVRACLFTTPVTGVFCLDNYINFCMELCMYGRATSVGGSGSYCIYYDFPGTVPCLTANASGGGATICDMGVTCFNFCRIGTGDYDIYCNGVCHQKWCCGEFVWNSFTCATAYGSNVNGATGCAIVNAEIISRQPKDTHIYTCLLCYDAPINCTYLAYNSPYLCNAGNIKYDVMDENRNVIGCDFAPNQLNLLTDVTKSCLLLKIKENGCPCPEGGVAIKSYALAVEKT